MQRSRAIGLVYRGERSKIYECKKTRKRTGVRWQAQWQLRSRRLCQEQWRLLVGLRQEQEKKALNLGGSQTAAWSSFQGRQQQAYRHRRNDNVWCHANLKTIRSKVGSVTRKVWAWPYHCRDSGPPERNLLFSWENLGRHRFVQARTVFRCGAVLQDAEGEESRRS